MLKPRKDSAGCWVEILDENGALVAYVPTRTRWNQNSMDIEAAQALAQDICDRYNWAENAFGDHRQRMSKSSQESLF